MKAEAQLARLGKAWRGSVEFADRFVRFTGCTGDNRFHSHVALQLVVASSCRVELEDGRLLTGTVVAVRPHVRHRLHPLGDGRVYLVEPHSDLGAALDALLPPGDAALADRLGDRVLTLFGQRAGSALDFRLERGLAMLAKPEGSARSIAEIAGAVGLSPARLRSLARQQLAMPLGRWRRWAAMRRACEEIAAGARPADAAAAGGFADQAHLTRTMRAMLGITPAQISAIRKS